MEMGVEESVEHNKQTHVPKTDKKALAILSMDSKFFSMLSKSRFFTKHKGTYYDPLYEYYTSEKNDIAHFLMYQTGAKTGRFSVELAQTFPKPEESKLAGELHEVRKCLIPRRGKAFLCMDYEQQEMRLFAHYSNCEHMIETINKNVGVRGYDIYVDIADMLFGDLFQRDKLRKALRFITKTDALQLLYGSGEPKLLSSTLAMMYEKFDRSIIEEIGVDKQWAYDVIKKYKALYPVDQFNRECMSELYKTGVMKLEFNSELMNFKREYRIPRDFAYKAGNAKIQGCLSGESRIYTIEHGYVTLKEVVNKAVTVWDGERFVEAQCLYSGKKQKVVVQFHNGQQIVCSPEHKFLRISANVEWCQAKDLKKGHRIVTGNSIPELLDDIRGGLQHDFDKYSKSRMYLESSNKIDFTKIKDFDFGVILGRLVSDGSVNRDCEWLVAEHEIEIYEYVKSCLELMGKVTEFNMGVRKGRNEIVYRLTLGSNRLSVLFKHLKTEMPNWLFRNTEILRGYLRGLFDGDGSVSTGLGVVMLVQGGETSWKYMRRVQESLLLFGIHSRLHFYEYPRKGYDTTYRMFHLQISKKDNKIFVSKIGFISNIKQNKIKYGEIDNAETVYSSEKVDFKNITNEEIDMYDIVNSESGRYMANGLVTHNTAAYVIKHAMKRVDERIKSEGWVGRADMILQVHDELIFEVDNNLSFIKQVYRVLKQEMDDTVTFKVPITTSAKWSSISLGDVKELI
jgi:DNA polymerase I-like protein with 3'-5' exonuclease and polymerase domains